MRARPAIGICIIIAAVPLLAACSGEQAHPGATTETLQLATADGVNIAATLYRPAQEGPPGLILVHALGRDRSSWAEFAERARREGIMCLAFDMRGHGESTRKNGKSLSYTDFETSDWLRVEKDIDAARRTLVELGASPNDLAIAGASIGANLALLYAEDHEDMQAAVLLSPGLDYRGVQVEEAMDALQKRPVLLMTSQGDSYSASACAALKRRAEGFCELRQYPGSAHGTDILVANSSAPTQILLWLDAIIGANRPIPNS